MELMQKNIWDIFRQLNNCNKKAGIMCTNLFNFNRQDS